MTNSFPAPLQRAIAARAAYFERGHPPEGMIDSAIYRSWGRCVAASRDENEKIEFSPLERNLVRELLDGNVDLLAAAKQPLEELTRAIVGAGYAVLLTDARGYALAVGGATSHSSPGMRQAFRQGINLSEQAIGTSAMACALNERRAVRVFGPEHYFSANQNFHCAAAPVIAPDGHLLGVVDITRDSPKPDFGALALVSQCAQAIERELFGQLSSFLTIDLAWTPTYDGGQRDLILAFGRDGELLGLNENARVSFGTSEWAEQNHFEDIFEGQFGEHADLLKQAGELVPIRLRSGLSLFATSANFPSARRTIAVVAKPPERRRIDQPRRCTASVPEFGDPQIGPHLDQAGRAMAYQLPVLLLGETGVGKEVVARTLHARSDRKDGPFVAINCAAIPESLIEGELFGHSEGAYTGARRGGSTGQIEQAHGGTLFLDEIGDMPPQLQSRLLRVLESREVRRLGSGTVRPVDFQLICATLRPLEHFIESGQFREDLFYRINGYRITLPPLRERPNIADLISSILDDVSQGSRRIDESALAALARLRWPGNVRELKFSLTRAHSLAEPGRTLRLSDFEDLLAKETGLIGERPAEQGEARATGLLSSLEERAIRQALAATDHDVRTAARLLGISRATLYRRIKAF